MGGIEALPQFAWLARAGPVFGPGEAGLIERGMNELCPVPGCSVERVMRDGPSSLHVVARSLEGAGRCPSCWLPTPGAAPAGRGARQGRRGAARDWPGGSERVPVAVGEAIPGGSIADD